MSRKMEKTTRKFVGIQIMMTLQLYLSLKMTMHFKTGFSYYVNNCTFTYIVIKSLASRIFCIAL